MGSQCQWARGRGRAPTSRPVRDSRQFPARPAGEPQLDRRLERPAWDARAALRAAAAAPEDRVVGWHDGLALAGGRRAGLPIALLGPDLLQAIGPIAERHRGLKLIIDHFGRPDATWSNLPELIATAKHPNIALKATGAPSYSHEPYPYRDIHDHIRKLYDAFGPERMFWGTDITRMPTTWKQCVTMFTEELPWLSGSAQELVMGRAVCDWLGWTQPR
jgi:predicted TIM-barrel fold metal-dependent hydrolase